MKFQYFVYILECSDGSYYTGITNNLDRRLEEHEAGIDKKCYTFRRRPFKLKFNQEFNDVLEAIYFEKRIKGWTKAKKFALISGDFKRLQILAECRNATHYKYNPER